VQRKGTRLPMLDPVLGPSIDARTPSSRIVDFPSSPRISCNRGRRCQEPLNHQDHVLLILNVVASAVLRLMRLQPRSRQNNSRANLFFEFECQVEPLRHQSRDWVLVQDFPKDGDGLVGRIGMILLLIPG